MKRRLPRRKPRYWRTYFSGGYASVFLLGAFFRNASSATSTRRTSSAGTSHAEVTDAGAGREQAWKPSFSAANPAAETATAGPSGIVAPGSRIVTAPAPAANNGRQSAARTAKRRPARDIRMLTRLSNPFGARRTSGNRVRRTAG